MLRKRCKHISNTFFVSMQALQMIPLCGLFNTVSKEQLTHERTDIKRALLKTVLNKVCFDVCVYVWVFSLTLEEVILLSGNRCCIKASVPGGGSFCPM